MADIAIFRINYKSDFILTLQSDAGWLTPFCIKFWTGAPSQAYFAGYDGTTYTHCAPVDGDPTKLSVQFDDHHLPIGDLKFQIGYHFTVADFPTSIEDEVINQAAVIIDNDGEQQQVMLDFNGETAPEIAFAMPAYANEAQRIANEQARIAAEEQRVSNEQQRISNEEGRISAEESRQENEQQRIHNEETRIAEFASLKAEAIAATGAANDAATFANEKAQLAADKAALAQTAATLANDKAQLAADKASLAQAAATLANDKAALAQQKADYAQAKAEYAQAQGDYAKAQSDIALADHERAETDHERAEADHDTATDDHTTATSDHTQAESDHTRAEADHTTAASDHTQASSDHSTATSDHTQAGQDHARAESDHTTAAADHTRAESDHTRAESDHAAVEAYVDSLGAFDISAYNATGGVLAKYADLTAALGTNGANIPDALRKGGMSVKFVLSSDNKYVRYNYFKSSTTDADIANVANWRNADVVDSSSQSETDLNISDEAGYSVAKFLGGHIKTKNFDSSVDSFNEEAKTKLSGIEAGAQVNDVVTDECENDFHISDENKNAIAIFKDGHIKTKNFDSSELCDTVVLGNDEICDYFAIENSGSCILKSGFGCTRYIDCSGCYKIQLKMPITSIASGAGIAFYNSSKRYITGSFIECNVDDSNGSEIREIQVPVAARYFRTTYWDYANSLLYGKFECVITYPQGLLGYRKYRPYQEGEIFFSVEVDQSVDNWQSTDTDTGRTKDIKKTTGVLLLPSTYSKTGKKTPIIMYCHGLSHGVFYGSWGSTANFVTQKQHFIERGYAVFDCNGAKDTERQANGANCFLSCPQNVNAYYRTFKYILDNYNVEDKIYVIGGSMGGLVSTQFCLNFGNIVKAFAILAGYTSLYSWWTAPNASGFNVYPAYFGVTGDDKTYNTNIEKLKGYAPELSIFEINGTTYFNGMECPVHAWLGDDDDSINMRPQLDNFILALRNSGKTAFIRKPANLGHEIVSGAISSIDNEVCDWFDSYK